MSYLALFKHADAQLRGIAPGYAIDAPNAVSPPLEATYGVNRVNGVAESGQAAPDPTEVARVLGLPVDQLDRMLEVRVPWLPAALWFVPSESHAEVLTLKGVHRGRIWTARELHDLLSIPGITKAGARTIAEAKREFGGAVTALRTHSPTSPRQDS